VFLRHYRDEALAEINAIAKRQNARSWELRTTTSLSRLLQGQNRKAEARALLAAICGWFTEGFDTRDLKQANALLTELAC
jgi:predicted ATPase